MGEEHLEGIRALVMGLGFHGGGVETVRYLVRMGAVVRCTDLNSKKLIGPSLEALSNLDVEFVLGEHRKKDFDWADIIIKNPAVPASSPWIAGRNNVETDISLFLRRCKSSVLALTGSKGKSTAVSALLHFLKFRHPGARLGGNITISPLAFSHLLKPSDPVILELSSWQLADLRGRKLLRPKIAGIINLMHDHQNRYSNFADYEADKTTIFELQGENDFSIFPDNEYGQKWRDASRAKSYLVRKSEPREISFRGSFIGGNGIGYFSDGREREPLLAKELRVPGEAFRLNLLFAGTAARLWGLDSREILKASASFGGIPYRMEFFLERDGIRYYDDTASTIPNATAAALLAMDRPVILIIGGTDKELDFSPFDKLAKKAKRIIMLAGSATDIWLPRLRAMGLKIEDAKHSMAAAVAAAQKEAESGDAVILSPGSASFGMFRHEFERGDVFKALVLQNNRVI